MSLTIPGKVQKLQQALHAKAKESPEFRFYMLYDKIYREGRSAQDAIRHVHKLLNTGHREVIDADLSGYFDTLPHAELMQCVARRVSDRHVLALIKQWLVVGVEEDDGRGGRKRTTVAKDRKRGIPQGAPISPLLSNLYMRRFLLGWKQLGLEARFQARIVNYADDFVICCRGSGEQAMMAMRRLTAALKLTVNEDKTQSCRVPGGHFDFLGYTFGQCYSAKTGRAYIGTRPSKKSIRKVCRRISEATCRRRLLLASEDQVVVLNRVLIGWGNYFCLGPVSKAYRAVDRHATRRLRRWLCKKHKQPGQGTARYPDEQLYEVLGLRRLSVQTHNLPWAKA